MISSELSDRKPGISTIFQALLILLLAGGIVVAILFLFRNTNTYDKDRSAKRYENLKKLKEEDAKKTTEYAVLDKAKGTFQLPLANAISLTAKELSASRPKVAYPIATPPPAEPLKDPKAAEVPAPAAPPAAAASATPAPGNPPAPNASPAAAVEPSPAPSPAPDASATPATSPAPSPAPAAEPAPAPVLSPAPAAEPTTPTP